MKFPRLVGRFNRQLRTYILGMVGYQVPIEADQQVWAQSAKLETRSSSSLDKVLAVDSTSQVSVTLLSLR